MRGVVLVAALLTPAGALAEPPADPFGPRSAVSVHPLAFLARGALVEYESYAFPGDVSLAVRLGLRRAALADFGGFGASLGVEARYWFRPRALLRAPAALPMAGAFLGGRVDGTLTHLREGGSAVGSIGGVELGVLVGYRVITRAGVIAGVHGSVTLGRAWGPSGGPAWGVLRPGYGMSVGWMFP